MCVFLGRSLSSDIVVSVLRAIVFGGTDKPCVVVRGDRFPQAQFVVVFKSSGGWVKIKLKLPHFHVSDTCRVSI